MKLVDVAGSGANGGLFTNSNASVADGSYVEVGHNQNTNDLITNGWIYDGSQWVEIDDNAGTTHDTQDPTLAAWYKMEEASGTLDNAEGNVDNDMIASGSATYQATGVVNDAITLDGTSDWFCSGSVCQDVDNFDFSTNSFSLGGWFKHDTIATNPDYLVTKGFTSITDISNSTIQSNLVAHWKMDETSGTRVDSYSDNDLADNNTVLYGTGKYSNAADFEEDTTEYLDSTDADLLLESGFTVSAWVKYETTGDHNVIASGYNGSSTDWFIGTESTACGGTSNINFAVYNAGWTCASSGVAPTAGQWYHVVATHNGSTITIYVNGTSGSNSKGASSTLAGFYVGRAGSLSPAYFDGLIDEAGFWNTALSASDVDDLLAAGRGYKLAMESDGDMSFGIASPTSEFPEDTATTTVASYDDNVWHHAVAVKDGTSAIKLYIDGVERASDTSLSATGSISNSGPLLFGVDGDQSSNPWAGSLDEMFVYSRALTPGEIEELYQANSKFKIVQVDANTVRLYNYSGATQNLRLDVVAGTVPQDGDTVSLHPATADVDSDSSTASIWINKTAEVNDIIRLQNDGVNRFTVGWDGHATVSGSLTIGQASLHLWDDGATGAYVQSTVGSLNLQAGGATAGSSGTSSINFLDSSGNTRGRFDTAVTGFGDGADGDLAPSGTFNLNTSTSGARSYADGIAYKVNSNPTGISISTTDTPNGIVAGDEILLINLQGTSGDNSDVGNYEFLEVTAVDTSSKVITIATAIQNSYDGTTFSNQKVIIQRIPNYSSVTLDSSDSLTASAWDGLTTTPTGTAGYYSGIVAFRATGAVSVGSGTSITTDGLGYRGGTGAVRTSVATYNEEAGESYISGNPNQTTANGGGGGGGQWLYGTDWVPGGGGAGYGAAGTIGGDATGGSDVPGDGGGTYGDSTTGTIFLGSGGGSTSTTGVGATTPDGGDGGGIILIYADSITVTSTGVVSADGGTGVTSDGGEAGGGGGGSGGTIIIEGDSLTLGSTLVTAAAGAAGSKFGSANNGNGGAGAVGRINVLYKTSISGTTSPSATSLAINSYGTLYLGATNTSSADVAEHYPSLESLSPGEVVSLDPENELHVRRSVNEYDVGLLGVVSTDPGVILGQGDAEKIASGSAKTYPVALAGRVPVKVSPTSSEIAVGDYLTSSSEAGYAMKATRSGMVIGRALEEWSPGDGKDSIEVFVETGFGMVLSDSGEIDIQSILAAQDVNIGDSNGELAKRLFGDKEASGSASESGTATDSGELIQSDLFGGKISISQALEAILTRIETVEGDVTLLKGQGLTASGSGTATGLLYSPVVADTLSVGGITIDAATNSIDAVGVLTLQSLGLGKVDVYGNMEFIDGHISGNDSFRGMARVKAGQNWVRVEQGWEEVPTSILVETSYFTSTLVKDVTLSGFTISLQTAPTKEERAYWLAIW